MRKNPFRVLLFASEVTLVHNEMYFAAADRARELGANWIFRACDNRPEHYQVAERFAADLVINSAPTGPLPDFLAGRPAVSIGSSAVGRGDVRIDESAIGRDGARHLADCGYRELAFLGHGDDPVSGERLRAFRKTARAAGARVHLLSIDYSPAPWLRTNPNPESGRRLRQWLLELPKPVGLCCLTGMQAVGVEMMCFELGLTVPDEVGILGCSGHYDGIASVRPGVSSLSMPVQQIGWALAETAHALLIGKPRPQPRLFRPDETLERGSTRIRHASDPLVAGGIRYIGEALDRPLRVAELAQKAGVSRSGFEQRFRAATGRSPLAEIHRQRIERAKQLLSESGMAIKQVADRCGIADPYQFSAFFKKHTGVSPRQFRKTLAQETPPGSRRRPPATAENMSTAAGRS
jgi:LacI family transcriptional regulator